MNTLLINPSYAPYAQLDEALRDIYDRLGPAVLIPFDDIGQPQANPASFQDTQASEYLRNLSRSNIAVRCGSQSGGLYAMRFSEKQDLDSFLTHNPKFRQTAVLGGPEGLVMFIRMMGFRPRTISLPFGSWFGHNAVVPLCRRRPLGNPYTWQNSNAVLEKEFAQIKWPASAMKAFRPDMLLLEYGEPFYTGSKNKQTLNYHYWAAYYANQHDVKYSADTGEFYMLFSGSDDWTEVSVEQLQRSLLAFMLNQRIKPGLSFLGRSLDRRELQELVSALRVVVAGPAGDAIKGLKEFVTQCLEVAKGNDVTVDELYRAFRLFCDHQGLPLLPEARFQKLTPPLVAQKYLIGRSHSVNREGSSRRGYHNLRLKVAIHATTPSIAESVGTAGTAGTGQLTNPGSLNSAQD